MGTPTAVSGYSSKLDATIALAAQGLKAKDIAARIGSTEGSVYEMLRKHRKQAAGEQAKPAKPKTSKPEASAGGRRNEPESWTEERVELLKKLWAEGLSASQIAVVLGGWTTRNAVIGKVHRLKLSAGRPVKVGPARQPRERVARSNVPRSGAGQAGARASAAHKMVERVARKAAEPPFAVEPLPQVAELFIPVEQRLSLLQLTEHTCKWPIGDPLKPDFYFCGQHVSAPPSGPGQPVGGRSGTPYCEFHARRAYHQVDPVRPKVRTPGAGFNQLRRDRAAEREAV